MPLYTQSLSTSEPQKRKRDVVDEAPLEDLGRRNRKITKKAQGRNYDDKSSNEEENEESAEECIAKNGRGGRGHGRGRGGGKGGTSRGGNGKGGASRGKKRG